VDNVTVAAPDRSVTEKSVAERSGQERVSAADNTRPVTSDNHLAQWGQDNYRPVSAAFAIAPTVSVVIPVKNEARNLPVALTTLPPWVTEVVVVDGHSTDNSIAVAQACRPDVKVLTQPGKGKGDALLAGFQACTGEIIVMMDGDGSTAGSEVVFFVGALVAGADYAKGSRFIGHGGSDDITFARRLGNAVLSGLVNLAFGTRYSDLCYGYNAFWAHALPALKLDPNCYGFEIETLMNIRAAKANLRVQEIPSHERLRMHGESNLHVFVDGWRILRAIVAEAVRGPRRRHLGALRLARQAVRGLPAATADIAGIADIADGAGVGVCSDA
jgi:Glycosyl transferase family 2